MVAAQHVSGMPPPCMVPIRTRPAQGCIAPHMCITQFTVFYQLSLTRRVLMSDIETFLPAPGWQGQGSKVTHSCACLQVQQRSLPWGARLPGQRPALLPSGEEPPSVANSVTSIMKVEPRSEYLARLLVLCCNPMALQPCFH